VKDKIEVKVNQRKDEPVIEKGSKINDVSNNKKNQKVTVDKTSSSVDSPKKPGTPRKRVVEDNDYDVSTVTGVDDNQENDLEEENTEQRARKRLRRNKDAVTSTPPMDVMSLDSSDEGDVKSNHSQEPSKKKKQKNRRVVMKIYSLILSTKNKKKRIKRMKKGY